MLRANSVDHWFETLGEITEAGEDEAVVKYLLMTLCCEQCDFGSDGGKAVRDYVARLHGARHRWESEQAEANPIEYASITPWPGEETALIPSRADGARHMRALRNEDTSPEAKQRGINMRRLADELSLILDFPAEAEPDRLLREVKSAVIKFDFEQQAAGHPPSVALERLDEYQTLLFSVPDSSLQESLLDDARKALDGESSENFRALAERFRGEFEEIEITDHRRIKGIWVDTREQASKRFLWVFSHFYRALGLNYVYFFPNYFAAEEVGRPAVLTLGFKQQLLPQEIHAFARLATRMLHLPNLRRRLSVTVLANLVGQLRFISEEICRSISESQNGGADEPALARRQQSSVEQSDGAQERQQKWQAVFQSILSPAFGEIKPGFRTDIFNMNDNGRMDRTQAALHATKQRWSELTGNNIFWSVINFLDASGARVSAAVINSEGSPYERNKELIECRWNRVWSLFLQITNENQNERDKTTIGQFIVNRGEDTHKTPGWFEARIGPRKSFDAYMRASDADLVKAPAVSNSSLVNSLLNKLKEHGPRDIAGDRLQRFFSHLEIPAEVVRQLLFEVTIPEPLLKQHLGSSYDVGPLTIYGLVNGWLSGPDESSNEGEKDEPDAEPDKVYKVIRDLWLEADSPLWAKIHESEDFLLPYLRYVRTFLSVRYYGQGDAGLDPEVDRVTDDMVLLMLLGNLILSIDRLHDGGGGCAIITKPEADGWNPTWQCQYCIPTWVKNVSFLYLVTQRPLEERHLYHFQALTDRIIATAWSFDSEMKHRLERKRIIERGTRAARAAVMSRNLSHNLGSHVLASLDTADYKKEKLEGFLSFLQERMDFLARITTEWPVWGQPMHLLADILIPFVKYQELFFKHIVGDQWTKPIEFLVRLDIGGKREEVRLCPGEEPDTTELTNDPLVSVPEGGIGVHAFYVLIENILRNSAKYGRNKAADRLLVCVDVAEYPRQRHPEFYSLKISDNLSVNGSVGKNGESRELVEVMREKVRKNLIDQETGEIDTDDWGIIEMKTCADFLVHPFEEEGFSVKQEVPNQQFSLWPCVVPNGNGGYLGYELGLQKARLVALVNAPERLTRAVRDEMRQLGLACFDGVKDLHGPGGAYQFALVFLGEDEAPREKMLDNLKKLHRQLPYRVLLLAPNGRAAEARDAVRRLEEEECERPGTGLPARRVFVCEEGELPLPATGDRKAWGDFVLRVYEAWIRHSKGLPADGKYKLVVSFERPSGSPDARLSVFAVWKDRLRKSHKPSLLDVYLLESRKGAEYVVEYSTGGLVYEELRGQFERAPNEFVVYDNHRALLRDGWEGAPEHFRHLTGHQHKNIYHELEHPPAPGFPFTYFLLNLIEAGLMKVVIIDERVGEAALKANQIPPMLHHASLNSARCYPIYTLTIGGKNILTSDSLAGQQSKVLAGEGVDLDELGESRALVRVPEREEAGDPVALTELRLEKLTTIAPDFLVMHQGVIDTKLPDTLRVDHGRDWFCKLYQIAPIVVITSGRGKTRMEHVPPDNPFLEFAILKSATFPQISKYHLALTLGSVKGGEEKRG